MNIKLYAVLAIMVTMGLSWVILTLIFFDIDKPISTIPMYTSDAKLVDSPDVFTTTLIFGDQTADRVITLPDRDMNWQELLWEAYQQGYDQGVKDSQTSTEK